ncbi:hypothetical protein AM501_18800 [Aneurinibacillus migulanus]|nr:hypothetical protein TS64_14565 [Aneurinibacillus migulanus]KPD06684.1 hypothetical protein AM501_18800 [Aneurinibacillus migulanus]
MDAPCAPAEERQTCLFPTAPAHRPAFFSSLSPQEFVDLSNQMYIAEAYGLSLREKQILERVLKRFSTKELALLLQSASF